MPLEFYRDFGIRNNEIGITYFLLRCISPIFIYYALTTLSIHMKRCLFFGVSKLREEKKSNEQMLKRMKKKKFKFIAIKRTNEFMSEYGKILQIHLKTKKECKFFHPCFAFTIAWRIPISLAEFLRVLTKWQKILCVQF